MKTHRIPGLRAALLGFALVGITSAPLAGPYSAALDDPSNPFDAPVAGFVGPHGEGKARQDDGTGTILHPENFINPVFFDWAADLIDYSFTPGVESVYTDPEFDSDVLGPTTGIQFFVKPLGDLWSDPVNPPPLGTPSPGIIGVDPPGSLTVSLNRPISDLAGADFVVFENAFLSEGGAGVAGQVSAELAYVEVASESSGFVRFPAVSNTPGVVGPYGTVDPTNVFNLLGKHVNANGENWGTPFDLADLRLPDGSAPITPEGPLDLNAITRIRVVDIPGNGSFTDSLGQPIYDAWYTWGSGGADIEAFGVISSRITYAEWPQLAELASRALSTSPGDDPNGNGRTNFEDYALARLPWTNEAGGPIRAVSRVEGNDTFVGIAFTRDERLTDVVYEIESNPDLANPSGWTAIARSVGGAPFQPVIPFNPTVEETSASANLSIGVLRSVAVYSAVPVPTGTGSYLRLVIKETTP